MDNKIDLYADGLKLDEFNKDCGIEIDGYTFNPSLFKKNGATDYLDYSKKILSQSNNKPVSLEVFADEEAGMIKQAKILNSLAENVYVKIPITFTNKQFTSKVLYELVNENIKLNITAIFTIEQINKILPLVKETDSILSVFAGRIFDCGVNATEIMKSINTKVHNDSKCRTLWASPRMTYDYINAMETKTDIITMQIEQIKKIKMFEKNLDDYSLETIKIFYEDAKSSGFKI